MSSEDLQAQLAVEQESNQMLAVAKQQAETELAAAKLQLVEVNRKVRRRTAIGGTVLAAIALVAAIAARNQGERAKIETRAVGIQVDAAKAQAEGLAGRQLVGLVQGIRAAGRYQQLSAQLQAGDSATQSEFIEAKLQTQAVLTSVYGIQEHNSLEGHQGSVSSMNFSPDGKTIVSGGYDGTVKLWTLDGTEHATLKGHQGRVSSVNFSPDGKTIVSGGSDGRVNLWAWDLEQLLQLSCSWAGDYLRTSPEVSDADRQICGLLPPRPR